MNLQCADCKVAVRVRRRAAGLAFLDMSGKPHVCGSAPLVPELVIPEPAGVVADWPAPNVKLRRCLRWSADLFLYRNPKFLEWFEGQARRLIREGRLLSAKALSEVVRLWVPSIASDPREGFRLNNNHTAYISRRLAERVPEFAEKVKFRKVKTCPPRCPYCACLARGGTWNFESDTPAS